MGEIERLVVYDTHVDGIVQIKFKTPTAAAACIKLMDGRFFAGRKISSFFWDGKTDYRKPAESDEEVKRRIDDFGKWLEGDSGLKAPAKGEEEDEEEEKDEEEPGKMEEKRPKNLEEALGIAKTDIDKILAEKLAELQGKKLHEEKKQ